MCVIEKSIVGKELLGMEFITGLESPLKNLISVTPKLDH
jgi:hypothetical protein